ncbi:hypothetical protein CgunFtcFv8_014090 [Champsocephalus gunnari]|uniref:Uncharacterized protein n=1 Tax=Champsocephalus gunnari TaxID=52237 RepID=A0AAN8E1V6_CHAGU|nr:hypothetical protein CgunFtcFv8_014090 [Champsocephalus gunnari]
MAWNTNVTTGRPPVYARARRLNPSKLAIARAEFATMDPGHCPPLRQSLGFPPARRSQTERRVPPVRDYRQLNDATTPERYPVPHIQDFYPAPLPAKVEAVAAFPRPLTARSLREFLGMVTFFHTSCGRCMKR